MAKLQRILSPTVNKIYEKREETQSKQYIDRIPTKMVGDKCIRAIWYDFRFCEDLGLDGVNLRSRELDKTRKATIIRELSSVGCVVSEIDQRNGKPWSVSEYAGHLFGELDGIIESGIEEAPSKAHVLKIESVYSKTFGQVKIAGIEKALPYTFAAAQAEMYLMDIDRTFVIINCNDSSELHAERIKLDREQAKFFIDRIGGVITAEAPPVGISDNKNSQSCLSCPMSKVCHDGYMVKPTCRNCCHSTCDREQGGWVCTKWNSQIPFEAQTQGCDSHLYNPAFMPWGEVIDANDQEQWVRYSDGERELTNAVDKKHGYTSDHLYSCPPELIDDANIFEMMARFDAEIIKDDSDNEAFYLLHHESESAFIAKSESECEKCLQEPCVELVDKEIYDKFAKEWGIQ